MAAAITRERGAEDAAMFIATELSVTAFGRSRGTISEMKLCRPGCRTR